MPFLEPTLPAMHQNLENDHEIDLWPSEMDFRELDESDIERIDDK
jgi:hypothetical protein